MLEYLEFGITLEEKENILKSIKNYIYIFFLVRKSIKNYRYNKQE